MDTIKLKYLSPKSKLKQLSLIRVAMEAILAISKSLNLLYSMAKLRKFIIEMNLSKLEKIV